MAIFNIARGLPDAVSRRFGIIDDFSLSAMPELAPTFDIDTSPEMLYHQGWRRWCVGAQGAAVAAQFGQFQFRMPDPPTCNSIAVLETVIVATSGAQDFILASFGYGPGNTDLTNIASSGGNGFRDGRQDHSVASQVIVSYGTSASALSNVGRPTALPMVANTPLTIPGPPFVVVPGNALLWRFNLANSIIYFTLVWRERALNDQENSV